MRSGSKKIVAALACLPLVACGMIDGKDDSRPRPGVSSPATAYDALPDAPDAPVSAGVISARPAAAPAADERPLIGDPYVIDGRIYTPADVLSLDEVGYAAVLPEGEGGRTANGEAYVAGAITAAHRTLPIPSYVEVTAIDSGRTILVRINDRGPLLADRIIALSPGAARQLGIASDGTAGVRVRKVNPLEQDRRILRTGSPAAERLETPPGLRTALAKKLPPRPAPLRQAVRTAGLPDAVAAPVQPAPIVRTTPVEASTPATPVPAPVATVEPTPEVRLVRPVRNGTSVAQPAPPKPAVASTPPAPKPAPPPSPAAPPKAAPARGGGYVVQVAALSSRARADALARAVGGYVMPVGSLFRVRTGPYPSEAAARSAAGSIHAKGYAEARAMANDAR